MDIHDVSVSLSLSTYLKIIGAEIITEQSEYGGKWESHLVRKGSPIENFSIAYYPEDNHGAMELKKFVAEGSSPKKAIEEACEMIKREKIFLNEIEFYFPFEKVTP